MKSRIIISENYDPAYNLALEEYLIEKEESILYLWQNDKTIVIGRNQNPYKECNIDKIKKDKINLVRRRSGGGAVYHDLGNLNFTIISKKNNNNINENFEFVNKALNSIGVESVFNGRNDLHVLDKKISGNAFFEENNIFCHHGTLLVDVDINKLSQYLTASKLKLDSKGIKSIKSRVLNLKDMNKDITIDLINNSFIEQYRNTNDVDCVEYIYKEDMEKNKPLMEKVKRYKSWEWTYGESPKSNLLLEEKFSWGIIEFNLYIESGVIENCKIYTDSIINDDFKILEKNLLNKKIKKESLLNEVSKSLKNKSIKDDLYLYINNLSII